MSLLPIPLRDELRATLRLAGPVVAAQLAHISMSFIDTVMVGRLGPEALAGASLGHAIFFSFAAVGMGVVRAIGPMVSQADGGGRPTEAARSLGQGLWLALALGLLTFLALNSVEPVLR